MTIPRRNNKYETPFGAWLRNHPELDSKRNGYDCEDIDHPITRYMWHQYRDGRFMLLECKEYNAYQSFPQKDTQSIIDQALQFAFNHPDFYVHRELSYRPTKIRYYGYHLVQFERTMPDDGRIKVDGKPITREEFLRFLKFEGRLHTDRSQLIAELEEIVRIVKAQEVWDNEHYN